MCNVGVFCNSILSNKLDLLLIYSKQLILLYLMLLILDLPSKILWQGFLILPIAEPHKSTCALPSKILTETKSSSQMVHLSSSLHLDNSFSFVSSTFFRLASWAQCYKKFYDLNWRRFIISECLSLASIFTLVLCAGKTSSLPPEWNAWKMFHMGSLRPYSH
jgi:hypothetical protein